jgi:hypothetical protein
MMTYAQHVNCTSISDTAVTISRWGEFYTPVPGELECWTVDLDVEGAVKISYNMSLDCFDAIDHVTIYELDDNNQAKSIGGFCATIESGVWVSTSHRFKVEYWGFTGNLTNDYEGFQLHFEEASQEHVVNHDYYVLGKLGVGTTQPQEMLHVNGAISGGGTNGEVTLKGDNGSVTIGATDAQTMTFNTDKSKYAFNTNGTNRMVILSNGNVGIGIQTPETKLHVNNGVLKIGDSASQAERLRNLIQIGDENFVQIGEWEKDDYLSFKASGYNFTGGAVGIGFSNPQYRLDVNGAIHAAEILLDSCIYATEITVDGKIRAEEIIVNTTGADFVFADDYQLRPLSEVEAFITENKHLPEIKSAQEMQEEGVSVSELQTQLLQKIEELTLYLIQQEQTIKELRKELEQLKK